MSDSQFQTPSNFTPAFSPFDTFEMPTSDFVLELPPLTTSSGAQDDDQLSGSEPVRCFSVAYQDRSESAVSQPSAETAAAADDAVSSADNCQIAAEPKQAVEQTSDANVSTEDVSEISAEQSSVEALKIPETEHPENAPQTSVDICADAAADNGADQQEVGVTVVASLDDDDDDDVDDVMLPPPIKPEALAAVIQTASVSLPEQLPPHDTVETLQPAVAEVADHAPVPQRQVESEPMIADPASPNGADEADTVLAGCDAALAVPDALTSESPAVPFMVDETLREYAAVEHAIAEPLAVEEAVIHESVIEHAVSTGAADEESEIEHALVAESVEEPSAVEPELVEAVAAMPVMSEQPVAEFLPDFAESFVAMPQVSVASEVFQDDPCATSSFQPQPSVPEPIQAPVLEQRSAPARQPKPVSVKVSAPANSPAPANASTPAPVEAVERVNAEFVEAGEPAEPMFRDLDLSEGVHQAVQLAGYERPTAIQAQIIPHILEGRDVLAQSQTGTGKTAAFALPILSRLDFSKRKPQVLVLAPTRELAIQVASSFTTYGAHLPGFSVAAIYGGQDYEAQFRQLKRGVQVVVGTPGRVIDHINRGTLDLSEIQCLTLDEADEMLNMGFLEDVQFVLDHTPADRQVALFSATLPPPIRNIAQQYLKDPVRITIKQKTMTAESIRQRALFVPPRDKIDVLTRFLEAEETDGVIVFTKTKDATVTVADQLCQLGFSAIALNGDMAQKVRERTIQQLKNGQLDILVATDVAARGLDVTRVSHVFNFDVPNDSESYIHRIGRTGRAGRKGEAIIFLTNSQRHKLKIIERATRQPIEVVRVPGAEEINALRISRFQQKITETIQSQNVTIYEQMIREFAETSGQSLITIAAALAHLSQGGRPFLMSDRPTRKPPEDRERFDQPRRENNFNRDRRSSGFEERGERFEGQRNQRSRGPEDFRQLGSPEPGMDRYRIEVGRKDGVKPGNIVGAVANEGGINGDQIGPIRIHDDHSTIDLPQGMPQDVYQTLQQTVVAGRQLKLSRDHSSAERTQSRPQKRPFVPRKPSQFSHSKKRPSGAPPRGQR